VSSLEGPENRDGEHHYRVGPDPIDAAALLARLADGGSGAQAVFLGVVRREFMGRASRGLEYEAHVELAERELRRIGEELVREFGARRVVMVHRVGALAVGEASVFVGVAAPHRSEAFRACRAGIDRLKASAPIFKAELWDDGGRAWHGDPEGPPIVT
jgi:molybdopterin synthase catalytic subunit